MSIGRLSHGFVSNMKKMRTPGAQSQNVAWVPDSPGMGWSAIEGKVPWTLFVTEFIDDL